MSDGPTKKPVLIVDDDDDIRLILQETLELAGYDVRSAVNGREALAYLKSAAAPPGLILLDLMMPVMSGWEFRDVQRADPKLDAIPVVILTASRAPAVDAAAQGAAEVLYKPVDLDRLLSAVARCGV